MHTQEQLKVVSDLIKELNLISHPDSTRIAQEITKEYNFDPELVTKTVLRLKKGEPWEYIRGYSIFMDRKFMVNKNVLIPRIETEQLVELTVQLQKKNQSKNIIDVGTGSGAIVCSLAATLNENVVLTATDISSQALSVAKENARSLKFSRVKFIKNFLLDNFELDSKTIIVANLPYIPAEDYDHLQESVKDFEPRLALDGGSNGTELINLLLQEIKGQKDKIDGIILEMDPGSITPSLQLAQTLFPEFTVSPVRDFQKSLRFIVIER